MANRTFQGNISVDIDELNHQNVMKHLPILIILLVILVIGIIGNILVLVVYKFTLKRSSARVYIISLAMADLFVCIVGIPYHTLDKIWILNYSHGMACRTLSFVMYAGSFSSVFVLLVVGLDRFLKVCRPLKRQIKDFGDRKACIIAIITGLIVSAPILVLYGNSSYPSDLGFDEINCFVDDKYKDGVFSVVYLSVNLLIFILSVLFLVIIYGFICKKIYEHDQMQGEIVLNKRKGLCGCTSAASDDSEEELNEDRDNEPENCQNIEMKNVKHDEAASGDSGSAKLLGGTAGNKASKKQLTHVPSSTMMRHTVGKKQEKNTRKITLMMFTITVVFIIAYLPLLIISILDNLTDYWYGMSEFVALLNDFLLRVYVINNVANPIIYCFWDKRFRNECIKLLKRFLCCKGKGTDALNNTSSSSGSSKETRYTIARC